MHIKTLSLILGSAIMLPSLAMAAPADTATAETQTAIVDSTVEAKAESAGSETKVDEQNAFIISETQTISRARVNNNLGQQPTTTEIEAPNGQQPMTTEIKAPNGQQPMTTEIEAPAEAYQDSELQTTEVISENPVLDEPKDLAEASDEEIYDQNDK